MTKRDFSSIDTVVIHASVTYPHQDIGTAEIRRWHLSRGWSDIGYHYVIDLAGKCQIGRPLALQGAHVRGFNETSIGICYVGGLDEFGDAEDTINDAQLETISQIVDRLCLSPHFNIKKLLGHRDFPGVSKACPCFDVEEKFFPEITIHELNQ